MKKVIDLGGTSEEVASNIELREFFIPILRGDFKILENYEYKERKDKIDCNISIFYGEQDDITFEEILSWKKHANKGFKVYNFNGSHFFVNNNIKDITQIINETLMLK